ncbi:MAG: hypothetical protein ACKPJO_01175 [Dolichospermum sp.]
MGVWQGRSLFGDVGDRVNRARQLLRAIVPVIRGIVGKAIVFWDVGGRSLLGMWRGDRCLRCEGR